MHENYPMTFFYQIIKKKKKRVVLTLCFFSLACMKIIPSAFSIKKKNKKNVLSGVE